MKRLFVLALVGALAACSQQRSNVLQGYGEADYVYLASQDAGVVGQLFVKEGDAVALGAPVFRIDPERMGYEAQSARATQAAAASAVRQAEANAVLAEILLGAADLPEPNTHGSLRLRIINGYARGA